MGWGQDGESSHSAEAGHPVAGFMAFGPAGEKGGNVRNILTQQQSGTPPPPALAPSSRGVGGGLIVENIQMVEACPPSLPLHSEHPPWAVFGEEAGDR